MSIGAGDGKDRRKEEVVWLRVCDPEERSRLTAGCPKQKMGGGRSEAGAEVVVYTNLCRLDQGKIGNP